jgi:hypothetical protein
MLGQGGQDAINFLGHWRTDDAATFARAANFTEGPEPVGGNKYKAAELFNFFGLALAIFVRHHFTVAWFRTGPRCRSCGTKKMAPGGHWPTIQGHGFRTCRIYGAVVPPAILFLNSIP